MEGTPSPGGPYSLPRLLGEIENQRDYIPLYICGEKIYTSA
jgi:hypothetical protein